jgi:hypothetical protein
MYTTFIYRNQKIIDSELLTPNAAAQPRLEAGAQRTLEGVGGTPLILIEVPSSAYRRGMLALGKQPREAEETSGDFTPSRTSFIGASICTLAPWTSAS